MARRRRVWAGFGIVGVLIVALVAGYLGIGAVLYDRLSHVRPHCLNEQQVPRFAGVTPANLAYTANDLGSSDVIPELASYRMPRYQEVTFPSRGDSSYPSIAISGWWVPAPDPKAPAVILVHGLDSCKKDWNVLIPAGMLHRAGFSVLLIDLRNHGDSTVTDHHDYGGIVEDRDVLGAWDWLAEVQGVPQSRIGLFGASLGAAVVLFAATDDERIAAVWEDSGYADTQLRVIEEMAQQDIWLPWLISPSGGIVAELKDGVDIYGKSPLSVVGKLRGRPLSIVHGLDDVRTPPHHAQDLHAAALHAGVDVRLWLVPGAGHTREVLVALGEYERRLDDFFRSHL